MALKSVYVGIDVACAKKKRLPICFVEAGNRLTPLEVGPELADLIPRGRGNIVVREPEPFAEEALEVAKALRLIADQKKWSIDRIAIDAPAKPPANGIRISESKLNLSSFQTPTESDWGLIKRNCIEHLAKGGPLNRLPNANRIWMLYGFELFKHLRAEFNCEVIEVYPAAIIQTVSPDCQHKSTDLGFYTQLNAIAQYTGWDTGSLMSNLSHLSGLPRHDRLDAYMAAWIASLPAEKRRAYGNNADPDDSIWVPLI